MKLCWEATGGCSRVMCEGSPYRNGLLGSVLALLKLLRRLLSSSSVALWNNLNKSISINSWPPRTHSIGILRSSGEGSGVLNFSRIHRKPIEL